MNSKFDQMTKNDATRRKIGLGQRWRASNFAAKISALKYMILGIAVTGILLAASYLLEKTQAGYRLEVTTYELLQSFLPPLDRSDELPITIVDITALEPRLGTATSRTSLTKLVDALDRQHPCAIGIDIDFSPDEYGYVSDNDPRFFEHCLHLKNKTPVFLGISRTKGQPPDVWLGADRFKSLAALIATDQRDTRFVLKWIKVNPSKVSHSSTQSLQTLSYALSCAYTERPSLAPFLHALIRPTEEPTRPSDLYRKSFTLTNYSKLDELYRERDIVPDATALPGCVSASDKHEKFFNRLVLVGDATPGQAKDNFIVVGNESRAWPGIYLHACATYTMIKEPYYEFNDITKIILDGVISLLIIVTMTGIRYIHHRRHGEELAEDKAKGVQVKAIWSAIGLVMALGVIIFYFIGILWLDFFMAIFALAMHPRLEARIHSALEHRSNST